MFEAFQQGLGREDANPSCRELDRERKPVEPPADRRNELGLDEAAVELARSLQEQLGSLQFVQRRHLVDVLGRELQRPSRGHHDAEARALHQQICEQGPGLEHVLEVVDEQ